MMKSTIIFLELFLSVIVFNLIPSTQADGTCNCSQIEVLSAKLDEVSAMVNFLTQFHVPRMPSQELLDLLRNKRDAPSISGLVTSEPMQTVATSTPSPSKFMVPLTEVTDLINQSHQRLDKCNHNILQVGHRLEKVVHFLRRDKSRQELCTNWERFFRCPVDDL